MTSSDTDRLLAHQPDDPEGFTELTRELRRLRRVIAADRVSGDVRDEVALVRDLADRLEARSTPIDPATYEEWGAGEHIWSSPTIGSRSVVAPPLDVWARPDESVWADIQLDKDYEGPPGCVHGGIIAALFDEMLGMANAAAAVTAMTAELTISYRSPTPIRRPLRFEAHNTGSEGRKTWAEGTLHAGDRLCATATGLFIVPSWIGKVAP